MSEPAVVEGRVLPHRMVKSGWHVTTVHWRNVPGYDYQLACEGFTSIEDIRRELEIDWTASSGRRVYPEFNPDRHVAAEEFDFDPRRPIYCGWDWGGWYYAFVPSQINPHHQWLIHEATVTDGEEMVGVYDFASWVAERLYEDYAAPAGLDLSDLKLIHYGDPAGKAAIIRPGEQVAAGHKFSEAREARNCFDILRDGVEVYLGDDERGGPVYDRRPGWGWKVIAGPVGITPRLEAVRARLRMTVGAHAPALVIDPRAEILKRGFMGGYHYPQRADGSGRYELDPAKNEYSHPLDALGYMAARLFDRAAEERDPEEDPVRHEVRGRTTGRRGRGV